MADVLMPSSENDMNAGNAQPAPTNELLNGACDDDDNELTEEQKKIIEERLKALQARFKAFEEKTLKQKIDELMMSREDGLNEEQAEMALRICNNNEFEANDRLSDPEDGERFVRAVKGMVRLEKRMPKLKGRALKAADAKLERSMRRLRKRRDIDLGNDSEDEDDFGGESEDWSSESEPEPETEEDEMIQEVAHGVHFVRHSKKHVKVGRLKLDDALAQLAAAQARQEAEAKAAEEAKAAAEAKGEDAAAGEGSGGGEGSGSGGGEGSGGEGEDKAVGVGSGGEGEAKAEGAEGNAAAAAAEKKPAGSSGLEDLMLGWSEARIKAWNGRHKNENAYYYRFNAPGEAQANAKWSEAEHDLFMATLAKCNGKHGDEPGRADYVWGMFAKNIPGRVGYQCSNYYRTLVKNGTVVDSNYMVDEKGEIRFCFKNKGFERKPKGEGEVGRPLVVKPKKRPAPKPKKEPAPKKPKAPPKKKEKKKKKKDDDDKEFRCNVKLDNVRRSGRNAGKAKAYTDGDDTDDEGDDFDETPVLPGFIDPLTKMQVEDPAISPYGHVAGYETWCRVLRNLDSKDTCPFTRQPLKRRELIRLTHDNIDEYRAKIVETQTC